MALSQEVREIIREAARQAGDELKGRLPPHHMHPKGRNSYAHVYERIRSKFGKSYKECDDSEAYKILGYIEWLVKYTC